MLATFLGLPELHLDREKAMALAVAWVRFQQEYPATKISRKVSVTIDLTTAVGLTYFPVMSGVVAKMREAKKRPAPGFNIPPVNPQDARPGAPDRRGSPVGSEIVISSGVVPDKGKLDFGP